MLSTAALSAHLVTFGAAAAPFSTKDVKANARLSLKAGYTISNETFGKKSMLFIGTPDLATRHRLENYLERQGAKVERGYANHTPIIEVQVTYFKGWHWDE